MTPTKIRKKLVQLMEEVGPKTKCWQFHDKWAKDNPVREVLLLDGVLENYDRPQSPIYKFLSITSNYLEFEKRIRKGQPYDVDKVYEDTYEAYMTAWKEKHPDEDYDEWVRKRQAKDLQHVMNLMRQHGIYPDEMARKVYYY